MFNIDRLIMPNENELSYRWRERVFATSTMCFIKFKLVIASASGWLEREAV
jgi:hypothetical protein